MRVRRWHRLGVCIALASLLTGCGADKSTSTGGASSTAPPPQVLAPTGELPAVETVPLPIVDNRVSLGPENTLVQFRGSHVDKSKADHLGAFETFTGVIVLDADKNIQSIEIEIDAASLFTANEKLTEHLKSADFLDVNERPKITFASNEVEYTPDPSGSRRFQVVGDLTLRGATEEIDFPVWLKIDGDKLTLKGDLTIERERFGMNFGPDQVEDEVAINVIVGEKTRRPESGAIP